MTAFRSADAHRRDFLTTTASGLGMMGLGAMLAPKTGCYRRRPRMLQGKFGGQSVSSETTALPAQSQGVHFYLYGGRSQPDRFVRS